MISSDENIKELMDKIEKFNTKFKLTLQKNIDEVLKNYSNPNLEQFKPNDGYEFIHKDDKNKPLGIYHSHLMRYDGKLWVLIWYFKEHKYNYFEIIFDVIPHPTDMYRKVLNDIKNDPYTINPNTWQNFTERLKNILSFSKFNHQ